ncbi:MAG: 50S ribosomal protein L4 [Patescibacteria group bacterium]|nr:50S ribosomal protein L4 [Patescibacteria group bacterium]
MKIDLYNQAGEKVGTTSVSSRVFGLKPKPEIIHQVVVAMLANLRKPWANTKTRGEVRGGGKKPWRQKGTGRARAGSIRSPLWRGGGIIFGPRKERNYRKKINKKVKKLALKMALSDKVLNKKIIILDKLELPAIKTKKIEEILKKLPSRQEKTLLVLEKKDEKIILSGRNLPYLKITLANNLNLIDLLNYKYLLSTKGGLKKIEEIYGKES